MSEYQERHTVSRLVGAPPGYIAIDEGGQLTRLFGGAPTRSCCSTRSRRPHPRRFDVLLQVLDDGRLTDGRAAPSDFQHGR